MSSSSCIDCKYFASVDEGTCAADLNPSEREELMDGYCRRHPPTIGHLLGEDKGIEYASAQWPLVLSCDWCGDFKPWRKN